MRRRAILIGLVLLLAAGLPAQPAHSQPEDWSQVVPGIEYRKYHLNNPANDVFVARMDRSLANLTVESSIAAGSLYSGVESVRNMASRYNGAINYWGKTWGNTNQVAVAINGFFFNRQTGDPWSGQVQSGWYAQRFAEAQSVAGFAWQLDGEAFIDECIYHNVNKQYVEVILPNGSSLPIQGVNVERGDDQLILYTPQYDARTHTGDSGMEVLVELKRPALISSLSVPGVVKKIYEGQGNSLIPFDSVVLSASGAKRDLLLAALVDGDPIAIHQEITRCPSSTNRYDWTNTYASIGGDKLFLKNGTLLRYSDPESIAPAPRTAVAFNDQYIYFIVVDGYHPGVSAGMSINAVADFARGSLNAAWGVSQDSGSSSTMVVNGQVVNNVYCNYLDNCNQPPEGTAEQVPAQLAQAPIILPDGPYEPAVGNGLMMVLVAPKSQANNHQVDEVISLSQEATVRLGPGTNYAVVGTAPSGSQGVILSPSSNLNGVWAKGSYWWKVKFEDGLQGWIPLPYAVQYDFNSFLPILSR